LTVCRVCLEVRFTVGYFESIGAVRSKHLENGFLHRARGGRNRRGYHRKRGRADLFNDVLGMLRGEHAHSPGY
jgi:hypothetical protein